MGVPAATAAVTAWGGLESDRLDILTHFAPVWFFAGVAAAGMAACAPRGAARLSALAVAVVALVASAGLMAPELTRSAERTVNGPGPRLRLMTFNLWGRNRDAPRTVEVIAREDPDILVVQEGFEKADPVLRTLGDRFPYRTDCNGRPGCTTMILSRWPLKPSPRSWEPMAAVAEVEAPFGRFTVIGVHYTWPIPAGPQQAQGRETAIILGRADRGSALVVGDFNSTPWSFSLRRLDRNLGIPRRDRALPTWPAARPHGAAFAIPFPILPIDHVYAGETWRTIAVRRGPRAGSDHHPLIADLEWRPAQAPSRTTVR